MNHEKEKIHNLISNSIRCRSREARCEARCEVGIQNSASLGIKNHFDLKNNNPQSCFLILGKALTGKTYFSNVLYKYFIDKSYNPILLTGKNLSNNNIHHNINSFFKLSTIIKPYSTITIPINKQKLIYNFESFDKDTTYNTCPLQNTDKYTALFETPRYNTNNNYFVSDILKNVIIIDNIDHVNLKTLFFIEYTIRQTFNNGLFFGGMHLIFLGNNFSDIYYDNIFDTQNFHGKKKYLDKFEIINMVDKINIKTSNTLFESLPILYNKNTYLDGDRKKFWNKGQINIINNQEREKIKKLDLSQNKKKYNFFHNNETIFISNTDKKINEYNLDKLIFIDSNMVKNPIYAITPIKHFNIDKDIFNTPDNILDLLSNNYFKHKLNTLYIRKNSKIIFTQDINEFGIKKGTFGTVKLIKKKDTNTHEVSKTHIILPYNTLLNKEDIVIENNPNNLHVVVEINKKNYVIPVKKTICPEFRNKDVYVLHFPFKLGWCISPTELKYIQEIENLVVVLTKTFSYSLLEECILRTKKDSIGFYNTLVLHDPNMFDHSFLHKKRHAIK